MNWEKWFCNEQNEITNSFSHFERAHILGQSYIIPHTSSHWWMFKIGLRKKDIRAIIGQLFRMIASIVMSRLWVPAGNTGGTNVSPLKQMPLPADLQKIFDESV